MKIKIPWGLVLLIIGLAITFMERKIMLRKKQKRDKMKSTQKEILQQLLSKNENDKNQEK